jgi:hypothetical protein
VGYFIIVLLRKANGICVQRYIIAKHPGDKFWEEVNAKLDFIRKDAGDDKSKITK